MRGGGALRRLGVVRAIAARRSKHENECGRDAQRAHAARSTTPRVAQRPTRRYTRVGATNATPVGLTERTSSYDWFASYASTCARYSSR